MTDVREDVASTAANDTGADQTGEFIWYELMTPDADGATAFYDAVVGWTIGEGVAEYGGYRMIGRADGKFAGGVLPLTDEMQQHGARPTWLGYICVNDVDDAAGSIERDGGNILMKHDIPNVGRIAMVTDPQGAPFYVMKPIPPEPNAKSDVFSPKEGLGRCGWNELVTTDDEAARRFYGDQFGWTSDDFMPMGDMGKYHFLNHHGQMIGAAFNTPDGRPRWRFYFRVASIQAAKAKVEENGGTVTMGPHQVPTDAWIIIGTDPQGAEFALVGDE